MGYINYLFSCTDCGHTADELMSRDELTDTLPCPSCSGANYSKRPMANIMTTAFPDGTRRFDGLRTQRKLQKERKKLRKKRKDTSEVDRELHTFSKHRS